MPSGVTIRPAEKRDVEALAAMRLSLQEHLKRANAGVWDFSDAQKRGLADTCRGFLKDPDRRIVVACRADGEVVGMAIAVICRHEEYEPGRSGRLDDVWVSPGHRNAGLCRRMVERLLAFFQDAGIETIALNYVVGNAEAEAVWARLGFRPVVVTATARMDQAKP